MSLACRLAPGLLLCLAVTAAAFGLQTIEALALGRAWLEALVLAILLGALLRTLWAPGPAWQAGIRFGARTVLEVAVVLLGLSISLRQVLAAGAGLLVGIAGVVAVAIMASYAIGRALRLPPRMSLLVACGNSICGNSAIAAVAPVIGADGDDIAASIAFTAVLGIAVVLLLPLMIPLLALSDRQYGVLAGLAVYAVPQVLAATAPVSMLSLQLGTLVKLVRVLMLGPVILVLSLGVRRFGAGRPGTQRASLSLNSLVPWFILGFLALAALRSLGWVPASLLAPVGAATTWLTIVAMAALGLGTDLRMVARAGGRVSLAASLSLLLLGGAALGLIWVLRIT